MQVVYDTETWSQRNSAACDQSVEDSDNYAKHFTHSDWCLDGCRSAQHLAHPHQHSKVDQGNGIAQMFSFRWHDRRQRVVGSAQKLGDGRILARSFNSNDSFTLLLWKYWVGIYFYILYFQVFTSNILQNNEVDQGKEIQFSNSLKLIVMNKFICCCFAVVFYCYYTNE